MRFKVISTPLRPPGLFMERYAEFKTVLDTQLLDSRYERTLFQIQAGEDNPELIVAAYHNSKQNRPDVTNVDKNGQTVLHALLGRDREPLLFRLAIQLVSDSWENTVGTVVKVSQSAQHPRKTMLNSTQNWLLLARWKVLETVGSVTESDNRVNWVEGDTLLHVCLRRPAESPDTRFSTFNVLFAHLTPSKSTFSPTQSYTPNDTPMLSPFTPNKIGDTPFALACRYGYVAEVRLMVRWAVKTTQRIRCFEPDSHGVPPVLYLIKHGVHQGLTEGKWQYHPNPADKTDPGMKFEQERTKYEAGSGIWEILRQLFPLEGGETAHEIPHYLDEASQYLDRYFLSADPTRSTDPKPINESIKSMMTEIQAFRFSDGSSLLHQSVYSRDMTLVLLKVGLDPNLADTHGFSPLHHACQIISPALADLFAYGGNFFENQHTRISVPYLFLSHSIHTLLNKPNEEASENASPLSPGQTARLQRVTDLFKRINSHGFSLIHQSVCASNITAFRQLKVDLAIPEIRLHIPNSEQIWITLSDNPYELLFYPECTSPVLFHPRPAWSKLMEDLSIKEGDSLSLLRSGVTFAQCEALDPFKSATQITPLSLALWFGNQTVTELILADLMPFQESENDQITALFSSTYPGGIRQYNPIPTSEFDVTGVLNRALILDEDRRFTPLLFFAARTFSVPLLDVLIAHGADVLFVLQDKSTVLSALVESVCRLSSRISARIPIRTSDSAPSDAASKATTDLSEKYHQFLVFLAHPKLLPVFGSDAWLPRPSVPIVHTIAKSNLPFDIIKKAFEILIRCEASACDCADAAGNTVLHALATFVSKRSDMADMVRLILDSGLSTPTMLNKSLNSAFFLAVQSENQVILRTVFDVISESDDADSKLDTLFKTLNYSGQNVLHLLGKKLHLSPSHPKMTPIYSAFERLLSTDYFTYDCMNKSPYDYAIENGNVEMAVWILDTFYTRTPLRTTRLALHHLLRHRPKHPNLKRLYAYLDTHYTAALALDKPKKPLDLDRSGNTALHERIIAQSTYRSDLQLIQDMDLLRGYQFSFIQQNSDGETALDMLIRYRLAGPIYPNAGTGHRSVNESPIRWLLRTPEFAEVSQADTQTDAPPKTSIPPLSDRPNASFLHRFIPPQHGNMTYFEWICRQEMPGILSDLADEGADIPWKALLRAFLTTPLQLPSILVYLFNQTVSRLDITPAALYETLTQELGDTSIAFLPILHSPDFPQDVKNQALLNILQSVLSDRQDIQPFIRFLNACPASEFQPATSPLLLQRIESDATICDRIRHFPFWIAVMEAHKAVALKYLISNPLFQFDHQCYTDEGVTIWQYLFPDKASPTIAELITAFLKVPFFYRRIFQINPDKIYDFERCLDPILRSRLFSQLNSDGIPTLFQLCMVDRPSVAKLIYELDTMGDTAWQFLSTRNPSGTPYLHLLLKMPRSVSQTDYLTLLGYLIDRFNKRFWTLSDTNTAHAAPITTEILIKDTPFRRRPIAVSPSDRELEDDAQSEQIKIEAMIKEWVQLYSTLSTSVANTDTDPAVSSQVSSQVSDQVSSQVSAQETVSDLITRIRDHHKKTGDFSQWKQIRKKAFAADQWSLLMALLNQFGEKLRLPFYAIKGNVRAGETYFFLNHVLSDPTHPERLRDLLSCNGIGPCLKDTQSELYLPKLIRESDALRDTIRSTQFPIWVALAYCISDPAVATIFIEIIQDETCEFKSTRYAISQGKTTIWHQLLQCPESPSALVQQYLIDHTLFFDLVFQPDCRGIAPFHLDKTGDALLRIYSITMRKNELADSYLVPQSASPSAANSISHDQDSVNILDTIPSFPNYKQCKFLVEVCLIRQFSPESFCLALSQMGDDCAHTFLTTRDAHGLTPLHWIQYLMLVPQYIERCFGLTQALVKRYDDSLNPIMTIRSIDGFTPKDLQARFFLRHFKKIQSKASSKTVSNPSLIPLMTHVKRQLLTDPLQSIRQLISDGKLEGIRLMAENNNLTEWIKEAENEQNDLLTLCLTVMVKKLEKSPSNWKKIVEKYEPILALLIENEAKIFHFGTIQDGQLSESALIKAVRIGSPAIVDHVIRATPKDLLADRVNRHDAYFKTPLLICTRHYFIEPSVVPSDAKEAIQAALLEAGAIVGLYEAEYDKWISEITQRKESPNQLTDLNLLHLYFDLGGNTPGRLPPHERMTILLNHYQTSMRQCIDCLSNGPEKTAMTAAYTTLFPNSEWHDVPASFIPTAQASDPKTRLAQAQSVWDHQYPRIESGQTVIVECQASFSHPILFRLTRPRTASGTLSQDIRMDIYNTNLGLDHPLTTRLNQLGNRRYKRTKKRTVMVGYKAPISYWKALGPHILSTIWALNTNRSIVDVLMVLYRDIPNHILEGVSLIPNSVHQKTKAKWPNSIRKTIDAFIYGELLKHLDRFDASDLFKTFQWICRIGLIQTCHKAVYTVDPKLLHTALQDVAGKAATSPIAYRWLSEKGIKPI